MSVSEVFSSDTFATLSSEKSSWDEVGNSANAFLDNGGLTRGPNRFLTLIDMNSVDVEGAGSIPQFPIIDSGTVDGDIALTMLHNDSHLVILRQQYDESLRQYNIAQQCLENCSATPQRNSAPCGSASTNIATSPAGNEIVSDQSDDFLSPIYKNEVAFRVTEMRNLVFDARQRIEYICGLVDVLQSMNEIVQQIDAELAKPLETHFRRVVDAVVLAGKQIPHNLFQHSVFGHLLRGWNYNDPAPLTTPSTQPPGTTSNGQMQNSKVQKQTRRKRGKLSEGTSAGISTEDAALHQSQSINSVGVSSASTGVPSSILNSGSVVIPNTGNDSEALDMENLMTMFQNAIDNFGNAAESFDPTLSASGYVDQMDQQQQQQLPQSKSSIKSELRQKLALEAEQKHREEVERILKDPLQYFAFKRNGKLTLVGAGPGRPKAAMKEAMTRYLADMREKGILPRPVYPAARSAQVAQSVLASPQPTTVRGSQPLLTTSSTSTTTSDLHGDHSVEDLSTGAGSDGEYSDDDVKCFFGKGDDTGTEQSSQEHPSSLNAGTTNKSSPMDNYDRNALIPSAKRQKVFDTDVLDDQSSPSSSHLSVSLLRDSSLVRQMHTGVISAATPNLGNPAAPKKRGRRSYAEMAAQSYSQQTTLALPRRGHLTASAPVFSQPRGLLSLLSGNGIAAGLSSFRLPHNSVNPHGDDGARKEADSINENTSPSLTKSSITSALVSSPSIPAYNRRPLRRGAIALQHFAWTAPFNVISFTLLSDPRLQQTEGGILSSSSASCDGDVRLKVYHFIGNVLQEQQDSLLVRLPTLTADDSFIGPLLFPGHKQPFKIPKRLMSNLEWTLPLDLFTNLHSVPTTPSTAYNVVVSSASMYKKNGAGTKRSSQIQDREFLIPSEQFSKDEMFSVNIKGFDCRSSFNNFLIEQNLEGLIVPMSDTDWRTSFDDKKQKVLLKMSGSAILAAWNPFETAGYSFRQRVVAKKRLTVRHFGNEELTQQARRIVDDETINYCKMNITSVDAPLFVVEHFATHRDDVEVSDCDGNNAEDKMLVDAATGAACQSASVSETGKTKFNVDMMDLRRIMRNLSQPVWSFVAEQLCLRGSNVFSRVQMDALLAAGSLFTCGPPLTEEQHLQIVDAYYWSHIAPEKRLEFLPVVEAYQNAGVNICLKKPPGSGV